MIPSVLPYVAYYVVYYYVIYYYVIYYYVVYYYVIYYVIATLFFDAFAATHSSHRVCFSVTLPLGP